MALCAFKHCLGARMTVLFKQRFFKASAVHSDADRYIALAAGFGDLADILLTAYVARVYTYLIYSALGNRKRKAIVKVDIRNKRHIGLGFYLRDRLGRRHIGYGKAHDIASGGTQTLYLLDRCLNIVRFCIAHRLDRDWRQCAYLHSADGYFLCKLSFKHLLTPL